MNYMVELICRRIEGSLEELRKEFLQSNDVTNTRFFKIDDLLPNDVALSIYSNFPKKEDMRHISSFRESKYTFKDLDAVPQCLRDITFAIQHPKVISLIEKITGMSNQEPDSSLYAGGLSLMAKNNFLNPHIDNSHDGEKKRYRTLNLLYYITPKWESQFGGNLELWDTKVKNAVTIPGFFNRLVIMETNLTSWHSVSPVTFDGQRCCVSNYYFSKNSPESKDYFHVTSFSARPTQKIRRVFSKIDNLIRNRVRIFISKGLAKDDTYISK